MRLRVFLSAAAALLALTFLVLSVNAGGFTPKGTQPPISYQLLDPSDCSGCHGNFNNAANIEPFPTWAGSMMANASRDPLFWAALDVANNDVPGVGGFCLRCHAPRAWLSGRAEEPTGSPDGCEMVGDIDQTDNDFEGLTCHFCHRLMVNPSPPPGEQGQYFENAQVWLDDGDCTTPGSGPCRRGPYDFPPGGDVPPPHEWAFSEYHTSSAICANCHNVTSPAETLIDSSGTDTNIPFPVERTYKEWAQSDFAVAGPGLTTCQNCHMPDAQEADAFACLFEQNDRTGNMPIHRFAGGNTWVPAVLRGEYPTLGRTANFTATIAWANEMLQNQAAQIEVTTPALVEPGANLPVSVRVTNLSGHKLPTGYTEGRRMWIQVEVRNALNQLIFESGAYNAATGVLTEDAQIKVYRQDPGIWNRNGSNQCDVTDGSGNPIFHFVLNNCIKIDNRIPPLGFTGGSDPETRPVGYTYPETSPGSGELVNFDVTQYSVPIPAEVRGPLSVTARLYYQIASKDYVEFLRDQAVTNGFPDDCITRSGVAPTQSRGEILYDLWTEYGRTPPTQMGTDTAAVAIGLFADGFETGNTSAWSNAVP